VHHSDRGSQYASGIYTDLLKENGIAVSMLPAEFEAYLIEQQREAGQLSL